MAFDLILTNNLGSNGTSEFDRLNLDINFSPTGDLAVFDSTPKLSQDIQKILLTILGSDAFHPEYGSLIRTFIGTRIDNPDRIKQLLGQTTANALQLLVKFLNSGEIINFPDETIAKINSISVVWLGEQPLNSSSDPANAITEFDIKINITTGSGRPVTITQQLALPIQLRGSAG